MTMRAIILAAVLALSACETVAETRLAACGLYLTYLERIDLPALSDADFDRLKRDQALYLPACKGSAPGLSATPAGIRAAGDWLATIVKEQGR